MARDDTNGQLHEQIFMYTAFSITKLFPWDRGLLEKLTVAQLVKKCFFVYITGRFIATVLKNVRHLSLIRDRRISPHPSTQFLQDSF
jgi:hypothetical protein